MKLIETGINKKVLTGQFIKHTLLYFYLWKEVDWKTNLGEQSFENSLLAQPPPRASQWTSSGPRHYFQFDVFFFRPFDSPVQPSIDALQVLKIIVKTWKAYCLFNNNILSNKFHHPSYFQ